MLASVPQKASFLNRVITSSMTPARGFASVAFNVRNKFETAYETKMKNIAAQPKKVYAPFYPTRCILCPSIFKQWLREGCLNRPLIVV